MKILGKNKMKSVIEASELIINQITDPFFIVDKNLKIHFINNQALDVLGYTREEVVGRMTCADVCNTPLCKTEGCTIKRCMERRTNITGQTVARAKNGTGIPVRAACNAIYDKKGKPIGGYEIIADIRQLDEGFLNNMADPAFRTDENLIIQNINDAALQAMGYTSEEVIGKMTCADLCQTPVCGTGNCTIKNCMRTKSTIVAETVAKTKNGSLIPVRASCGVLLDEKGNPTGGFEVISDNSAFISMVELSEAVADGDLTVKVDEDIMKRDDAVGKLGLAMHRMITDLSSIMSNIIIGSQNLAEAVQQISSGNENLSQRSSEQASSLEEVASAIEEATANIQQNADNAAETNRLAMDALKKGEEGRTISTEAIHSINEINQSSKKIGEIISVINEIAFQTNLLALNAAVEAARAGEQGRGFAVVAGEVRNLAQRSASAAKEISSLIQDSVDKVEKGTEYVNKSGSALEDIITGSKSTSQLIAEIATASDEQRRGLDQINIAISELDSMTQQNAALVEETASASEELANQAEELQAMVEQFRISDEVLGKRYAKKRNEQHEFKKLEIHEPHPHQAIQAKAASDQQSRKKTENAEKTTDKNVSNEHVASSHLHEKPANWQQTLNDEGFEEY